MVTSHVSDLIKGKKIISSHITDVTVINWLRETKF